MREAIHGPDDHQHLMTKDALPGDSDVFSIFMRQSSSQKHDPNWLLVQATRRGYEQVAQSAFRIYPSDVDLTKAKAPVDVLAAFCEVFGVTVHAGDRAAKFIETMNIPKDPISGLAVFNVRADIPPGVEHFMSWSHSQTTSKTSMTLGLVYCINLTKYRASLIAHRASVR